MTQPGSHCLPQCFLREALPFPLFIALVLLLGNSASVHFSGLVLMPMKRLIDQNAASIHLRRQELMVNDKQNFSITNNYFSLHYKCNGHILAQVCCYIAIRPQTSNLMPVTFILSKVPDEHIKSYLVIYSLTMAS